MSIFDLLFLAAAFSTLVTLIVTSVTALRGRGRKALGIIRAWALCAIAYMGVALAVDFFRPQRIIPIGEPLCLDDWCLQVTNADRQFVGSKISYRLKLRIFSTARRVSQRANGAWLYLIDEQGKRYLSKPDAAQTPLDVQLAPEQSVSTARVFEVPAGARNLGLITAHGGPYCGAMSLLIIGEGGCLFNRPAMIRIG